MSLIENPKAITSWSGFIYQGMIALTVVLDKLSESQEIYRDYSVKIEKLDDFSLHNSSNNCVSIHQVKCKKINYSSGYTDAISSLKAKKNGNNFLAYLHTSVSLQDFNETEVALYKINEKNSLEIAEVEDQQLRLLRNIIENRHEGLSVNENSLKLLAYKLNFIIIDKVLNAHSENMTMHIPLNVVDREIKFIDFLNAIDEFDFNKKLDNEDFIVIIKARFSTIVRLVIEEEEVINPGLEHLLDVSQKITDLDSVKFIKFLQILTPVNQKEIINHVADLLDIYPTGFDDPFLLFIIRTYSHGKFEQSKSRYEVNYQNKTYTPYGMNQSGNRKELVFAEKLYRGMFENKKNAEFYYTNDAIVTRDTDIKNLYEYIQRNSSNINVYGKNGQNFNEPKLIELISLKKAYELLGI